MLDLVNGLCATIVPPALAGRSSQLFGTATGIFDLHFINNYHSTTFMTIPALRDKLLGKTLYAPSTIPKWYGQSHYHWPFERDGMASTSRPAANAWLERALQQ